MDRFIRVLLLLVAVGIAADRELDKRPHTSRTGGLAAQRQLNGD